MKKQTGFSLIELMVIVVVIGILLAGGIPSWRAFIADNELTSYTNDFVAALTLARSEAIRNQNNISVIAGNANWSATGWNIADDDGDGVAAANEILRSYAHKISSTVTVTGAPVVVTFDKRGLMVTPTSVFTVNVCDDRTGETGRQLSVNLTGRISLNPNFTCP